MAGLDDFENGLIETGVWVRPTQDLLTNNAGPYTRMRVDVGQTGFFAGREFRATYEFNIPVAETRTVRADTTLIDVVLQLLQCDLWAGSLRMEVWAGGTESASFTVPVPVRRTNRMTSSDLSYLPKAVFLATGTVGTDGTLTDVSELETGQGANHKHEFVADSLPFGVSKGLYYFKLINDGNAAARGILRIRYEERPEGV